MSLVRLLARPFPLDRRFAYQVGRAIMFGLFVGSFLLVFQPFGLSTLTNSNILAAGYGLVTTCIMMLLGLVTAYTPTTWWDEERWTVAKEILWTLAHLVAVGLGLALFSHFIGLSAFHGGNVLLFIGYALAVGFFPVAGSVLLRERTASRHFRKASDHLNRTHPAGWFVPPSLKASTERVILASDNQGEFLDVAVEAVVYCVAFGNYVEVWHKEGDSLRRTLLRTTMKALEDQLSPFPGFFRCHKSYLVRLGAVKAVSGNAQGFRLHGQPANWSVPVSRQHNHWVREGWPSVTRF